MTAANPSDSVPVLAVRHLSTRFGAVHANDDISFTILPGEVHAVIGPNGAGKTTLIAGIAGALTPDQGSIHLFGTDLAGMSVAARAQAGLARSFQITSLLMDFSVADNVAMAVQAKAGHSFRLFRSARRDPLLREPALAALAEVGLGQRADTPAAALSHGEHRQLELAMALASEPRLLLLDEPMAGMGIEDGQRMLALLQRWKRRLPMLLVEHDMDAVFALADRISVLVYGRLIATGTPSEIRADRGVRAAYLGDAD